MSCFSSSSQRLTCICIWAVQSTCWIDALILIEFHLCTNVQLQLFHEFHFPSKIFNYHLPFLLHIDDLMGILSLSSLLPVLWFQLKPHLVSLSWARVLINASTPHPKPQAVLHHSLFVCCCLKWSTYMNPKLFVSRLRHTYHVKTVTNGPLIWVLSVLLLATGRLTVAHSSSCRSFTKYFLSSQHVNSLWSFVFFNVLRFQAKWMQGSGSWSHPGSRAETGSSHYFVIHLLQAFLKHFHSYLIF